MRFCANCHRAMRRDPSSGAVVFRCVCGSEEKGGADDARVGGAVFGAGDTTAMYARLIRSAVHDRTNQLVLRNCPDCGLDYQTQIRVGEAEVVLYRCKCGRTDVGGDRPEAKALPRAEAQAPPQT